MGWLQSLFSPLKKLRPRSNKNRKGGINVLYEDIKSCECEDVQVLWTMFVELHTPANSPLRAELTYPSPRTPERL